MRLSVCCPVLNESFFIKLWFESVLRYADDVFIIDGGSTDGTIEIIDGYAKTDARVRYIVQPQTGNPYTNDWNENEVRNSLIAQAHGDYILMLDSDEMLGDDFTKEGLGQFFYGFVFVPFWRDIETVRLNNNPDPRWYGNHLYRMFPRGMARYTKEKHHCRLVSSLPLAKSPVSLFHLHYAMETFGNKPKRGDNRRAEMGYPHTDTVNGPIDWEYGNKHPEIFGPEWSVATRKWTFGYPAALEPYRRKHG